MKQALHVCDVEKVISLKHEQISKHSCCHEGEAVNLEKNHETGQKMTIWTDRKLTKSPTDSARNIMYLIRKFLEENTRMHSELAIQTGKPKAV